MSEIEHDASTILNGLQRIADGLQQQIATQRDLSEATKANTLSVQELTLTVERQRGETNTRFQAMEDRVADLEEEQKETKKRRWAIVMAGCGAAASWIGSHWPFHLSPPHGR